jgi:predicted secreted protein
VPPTARHLLFLRHQVSPGLGASSPTSLRKGRLVLHMCLGSYMLSDWWFSLWEFLGMQVSWYCCSSYGVAFPSSFNPSPDLP